MFYIPYVSSLSGGKSMRILILGGTVFLGRALVEAALARGYEITLFNRGKSNPELFPEVEKLRGDRAGDLSMLLGRTWDLAIDTNGYVPRLVRLSTQALRDSVETYTFISSLSVFEDVSKPGLDESGKLASMTDESVEEITGETYGPLKVLCERVIEETLPGRALVIRPGLIVGPHDPSDRFTYWPHRVDRGGEVLAPGRPERPVQFIDVRDLAEWTLEMAVNRRNGVYNANGPEGPLSMGHLLETCREVAGGLSRPAKEAYFTWASEEFLLEQNVSPWMEMPLWVPESDPQNAGFFAMSSQKAISAGLRFRSLADTVRDTLAWDATRPVGHPWRAGISAKREESLLEEWHRQQKEKPLNMVK
jgi:2'-hydroxyisoflavone reductase